MAEWYSRATDSRVCPRGWGEMAALDGAARWVRELGSTTSSGRQLPFRAMNQLMFEANKVICFSTSSMFLPDYPKVHRRHFDIDKFNYKDVIYQNGGHIQLVCFHMITMKSRFNIEP